LSDGKKEEERMATENEKEEDYDDKKIASPSEEPIVDGNTKVTVEKGRGEDDIERKSQAEEPAKTLSKRSSSLLKSIFGIFGPGVITGASDDDPSGIATYSQVGAQFGFGMLLMAYLRPKMFYED
jgi:hypothetical protein